MLSMNGRREIARSGIIQACTSFNKGKPVESKCRGLRSRSRGSREADADPGRVCCRCRPAGRTCGRVRFPRGVFPGSLPAVRITPPTSPDKDRTVVQRRIAGNALRESRGSGPTRRGLALFISDYSRILNRNKPKSHPNTQTHRLFFAYRRRRFSENRRYNTNHHSGQRVPNSRTGEASLLSSRYPSPPVTPILPSPHPLRRRPYPAPATLCSGATLGSRRRSSVPIHARICDGIAPPSLSVKVRPPPLFCCAEPPPAHRQLDPDASHPKATRLPTNPTRHESAEPSILLAC